MMETINIHDVRASEKHDVLLTAIHFAADKEI
jgi:hypothetical protein